MRELRVQEASLEGVQPAVVSLHVVEILFHLAVIAQHPYSLGHVVVICGDCPSLAACSEILSGIEAEGSRAAHGAGFHPTIELPGEVLSAVCLARIFDDYEPILSCKVQNCIHIGHLPVQMHWHHCSYRPSAPMAYQLP